MREQTGSIKIDGIVSKYNRNNEGDLEIFLKVNSCSNLPKLNLDESIKLQNAVKEINFLTYQIIDDEEIPKLFNLLNIEAGIPYSIEVLRDKSFKLDGSLINYLIVTEKNGEQEYYFPLEM